MTKQQVRVVLDINWIDALEDMTECEAVLWLQSNVPYGYILEKDYYGYSESSHGIMTSTREETDEEYETRLAKEAQEEKEAELRRRLREDVQHEKMERLRMEDVAVYHYLSKFPCNPHLNDLENLFRTTAQLEELGKTGVILDNLKECMARLEKGL